jgi:hypothetical protein
MAILNFPNSGLTIGDQYTGDNGTTYIYDGVKWVGQTVGASPGNSLVNGDKEVILETDGSLTFPTLSTLDWKRDNLDGPTLQIGNDPTVNEAVITGPTPNQANPDAKRLIIQGQQGWGPGFGSGQAGGNEGGDVYIWAGHGGEGADYSGDGGDVKLRGGPGGQHGGYVRLESGSANATNGTGGFLDLNAGDALNGSGHGGTVEIRGGRGTANGGDVNIHTASTNNYDRQWTFGVDGTLTLPNGMIIDASDSIPTVTIGGPNTSIRIDDGGAPPGLYIRTDMTGADHGWLFGPDGELQFPDGSVQTTAYTGQAGGGSGELYIMANVDGNIITSTDGVTWGNPVPSGVPTTGGPGGGIGKLEVHGGVIVYTRTDEGGGDGVRGSGLYYSTEIGTATLCSGTDADPGGYLYWNEVHFFHETDKWVAVGYWQYQQDSKKPIFAYSTDGISWTVKYVDSTFVTDHNAGNFNWEMTDVAYNPTDEVYVFVGKVGGSNYAGAFVTNNLNDTFDASIWVDVNMNARYIVNWPVSQFGGPPGYMIAVNAGTIQDVWTCLSPVSSSGSWSDSFNGPNDGWYQDSMIDTVGYVPDISEIAANGSTVVITTVDGQVAVPTPGPMNVRIPLPYTADINDISRTNGTIDTFDVSPIVGFQNNNWTTFDQVVNSGDDSFHIVINGSRTLVTCDLDTSAKKHNIGDVITLYGATFGGTSGIDDIVITVTGTHHPITTIEFTGDHGIANDSGEKIVISGVTSHTENGTTTEQSYNGTYYVKRIDNGGDPETYEVYTDQACTTPWDTSTYWPVNINTGTLTWSHGQFFDAAGSANSYFYIGNDNEQIFRSIDGGNTWVEQADLTGAYLNDFAYGTWGSGASSSGTVTIESPFVKDFFGPEVYFVKTNYGSEVDNIDTNVAITRGDHQGIYNPITNPDWNDNTNGPTNTEWNMDGWADLSNVKTRNYTSWQDVCAGGINTQQREFVMHDTENNKYYAIKFLSFQGGWQEQDRGGGFSYVRRLINTECWFNRDDGDDSESVVDAVGPGLTIARGINEGIYNSADEGGWNGDVSPTGTLWNLEGWSDLTNVTTRQYLPLYQVTKQSIGRVVCGLEFVMKDTINNKYYAIKFSYWGHGQYGDGGSWPGVRYTRREIDLTKVSHNVKFADGSIQTTAVTEQRLGVLPQKIVDTNQDRYLTLDDIGKHLFITQSGTHLRINDSTRQEFPVGAVITIINKSGGDIYIYKDNDDENGTIYGSNQNDSGTGWYVNDTGSGNMVTIIKIAQYYDGNPYSDWMIAGSGIGTD